jgi:hypothetical protein
MKNIGNKRIPILATIVALILIVFFSIIKVDTELTERIDGHKAITTTSKIILLDNEYNFESSIALCFIVVLISVIAFFYITDTQIINKVVEVKSKSVEFLTKLENKQNRGKFIGYIIMILVIVGCWKTLAYYEELKNLEKENHYVVFDKGQAIFMGFMRVGQIALPITIIVMIFKLILPNKRNRN